MRRRVRWYKTSLTPWPRTTDGFTIEDRARARFLRSRGVILREIAEFLGRPQTTVYGWVSDVRVQHEDGEWLGSVD